MALVMVAATASKVRKDGGKKTPASNNYQSQ